ncbi:MAG: hypothetical protein ABSC18_06615 [Verrucomicrobiota bacterium]
MVREVERNRSFKIFEFFAECVRSRKGLRKGSRINAYFTRSGVLSGASSNAYSGVPTGVLAGQFMLHDEHLPQKWPGGNPRPAANTLVDGIAYARQRMGDAALGLLRLFAAVPFLKKRRGLECRLTGRGGFHYASRQ